MPSIYDYETESRDSQPTKDVTLTGLQTRCLRGLLQACRRDYNANQVDEALEWLTP